MRTMHYRNACRIGVTPPFCMEQALSQDLPGPDHKVAAAVEALGGIENVVLQEGFDHPDSLTQDGITAYALALLRLRECASAAGLERLTNACDALAVTVSRLIEDRHCASPEKCEALTRFIVHAWAMIQMAVGSSKRHAMPLAAPLRTGQSPLGYGAGA